MDAKTDGSTNPAYRLLGRASSINVRKVLWTCDELNLQVHHEPWGDVGWPLQSPSFLVLNPSGLVPVLVHAGGALRESNTICRFLAQVHGEGRLLPAGALARARVEQWMDWQATELNNAWRYAFMALVRQSAAHQDPGAVHQSLLQWHQHMGWLDQHLAQAGPYAAGDDFTLADVVLGLSAQRWLNTPSETAGVDRPDLPAVAAWLQRLRARPGFQRHVDNGCS
jgi:glutathione S-transferase